MSDYSGVEKFLHKVYLSNYFIAKSSFELEESFFGDAISKIEIDQHVFVTGLARSGTTALMRLIYQSEAYASLTYNNMPILFMPNLWKNNKQKPEAERAHKDGIKVSGNSPEEFDEYFWKVFLKDSYINDMLHIHSIPQPVMERYQTYVKLIALSQKKNRWISKNNNNILRLKSISEIERNLIIVLYRDPVSHASSLMKLHQQFEVMQREDSFVLEYFNFLGHHEFGLNHKPFNLIPKVVDEMKTFKTTDINYWVLVWINYYQYLLDNFDGNYILISFSDITTQPEATSEALADRLNIDTNLLAKEPFVPPTYDSGGIKPDILERAEHLYRLLNDKRTVN